MHDRDRERISEKILAHGLISSGIDRRVIRTKEDPFCKSGGLAVMRETSLGTITKPIAMDPRCSIFPDLQVDVKEDANLAILNRGRSKMGMCLSSVTKARRAAPGCVKCTLP